VRFPLPNLFLDNHNLQSPALALAGHAFVFRKVTKAYHVRNRKHAHPAGASAGWASAHGGCRENLGRPRSHRGNTIPFILPRVAGLAQA